MNYEKDNKQTIEVKCLYFPQLSHLHYFISSGTGILLFAIGLLFFITIIGILPGFGILKLANMLITQKINCPNCDREIEVVNRSDFTKCKHCNKDYKVSWVQV